MEKLHPGAKWLFRIRAYLGVIFLIIFFAWAIFALSRAGGNFSFAYLIIALIVIIIVIAEIYARMAYNRWFFEFTPTSLKLERGIIWKRYSNIPYERVQNVDVNRGILARILGFSTVEIQTAGFHGGFGYGGRRGVPRSEGHLPAVGVERAEKIREFLMKKISRKGQGL